jgi:DNA (cytosine-5)-methyltransferase 1
MDVGWLSAEKNAAPSLLARQYKDPPITETGVVRRLTPLECERLQGYPDKYTDLGEWTDSKGKKHKDADSPRYKALGNSIALPFWQWMFGRIREQYPEEQRDSLTMGSLFDGIGGFPLCWQRAGGETLWVSEIEEFCIAVTKKRFGEETK